MKKAYVFDIDGTIFRLPRLAPRLLDYPEGIYKIGDYKPIIKPSDRIQDIETLESIRYQDVLRYHSTDFLVNDEYVVNITPKTADYAPTTPVTLYQMLEDLVTIRLMSLNRELVINNQLLNSESFITYYDIELLELLENNITTASAYLERLGINDSRVSTAISNYIDNLIHNMGQYDVNMIHTVYIVSRFMYITEEMNIYEYRYQEAINA